MRHILNAGACFLMVLIVLGCSLEKAEEKEVPNEALTALVIATDYQTGSYSVVNRETREAYNNIELIHQDSVCRYDAVTRQPYIIARLGSDAVDVVNPKDNWHISTEYSVGAGTNPQDIAIVSSKRAYIARYAKSDLLIVNPLSGEKIGTVDLSPYADEDGIPETSWLYSLNGKIYALLQRLNRHAGFLPTQYSLILTIDGAKGTVESSLKLAETNPFGKLRYNETIDRFVVIESGVFTTMNDGAAIDGGIEYFDPVDNTLSGLVITATELGGDIVDAAIVSETKGYAIVGVRKGTSSETHLVSFDPSTGEKRDTLLAAKGWVYNFIELTPDGTELWLSDRTMSSPGIRIFDTATNQELLSEPIDVGLPPGMICFTDAPVGDNPSVDAGFDSGSDSGSDAGFDSGSDSGSDAGFDSGTGFNPFASEVIEYTVGTNAAEGGYDNASVALGEPARKTLGGDVTLFYPPWLTEQIVSIGAGGSLIVAFDHKVMDNAQADYWGIDFLVFGNPFFHSIIADNIFAEPARISVSQDGITWHEIDGVFADDLFPSQGFTNTSSYLAKDGTKPTDFTKPVNPDAQWKGKTYNELLVIYDGSGGGTGVDFGDTGLEWIKYVKIYQDETDNWSAEIDGFADVLQ